MATLLKVLNNLADIKSAGVLHFASELRGITIFRLMVVITKTKSFSGTRSDLFDIEIASSDFWSQMEYRGITIWPRGRYGT